MEEVQKVIDEIVRPALQRDGGDLELVSFENNVLTIQYQGACGCCPHAAMGTLRFIEQTLKENINPEITVKMAQ